MAIVTALLKEFSVGGMAGEAGTFVLNASKTVEVPTKLQRCVVALVSFGEAPGAATQLFCDAAITSSAITISDAAVASKGGFYVFLGYR